MMLVQFDMHQYLNPLMMYLCVQEEKKELFEKELQALKVSYIVFHSILWCTDLHKHI